MSGHPKSKKLSTYYIPKSIYDDVMDYVEKESEKINKRPDRVGFYCHHKKFKSLNSHDQALCHANILEAARQAFENRNFRALYQIIYKGLDKRDIFISKQLFEYLYAAIEIDPKITNRQEMLVNAVKGYKSLKNDEEAKDFIKRAHLLVKMETENDEIMTEEESD